MKDIHSHIIVTPVFGPVAMGADNTPAELDLQGVGACELVIDVGIGGITFSGTDKIEFQVTHCDTSGGTFTDVTDADIIGVTGITGGIVKSLIAAHAAAATYNYGYRGGKRFLKVLANFSGTHGANTPLSVRLIKSHLRDQPQIAA